MHQQIFHVNTKICSTLFPFSPIPVNVDDADKNKLIRTSPQPIPQREEEENFGGPSKYPPQPKTRSYEHFKVTRQNYNLLLGFRKN